MTANPLELRGRHRVNNMNPEADLEADGWGNVMAEAYTGNALHGYMNRCCAGGGAGARLAWRERSERNFIGHRAVRNRLKVDIAP